MKVSKVLNNNVIIAITADKKEQIMMGKGIGFQAKKGDLVDQNKVEKIFTLEGESEPQNLRGIDSLDSIPPALLDFTAAFVEHASAQLQLKLKNSLTLALADHIYYAVERLGKGLAIHNALLHEIKEFYPQEFALGQEALQRLKTEAHLNFPEDEAGFIALHLVNASLNEDMAVTREITSLIQDVIAIVKNQFGLEIQEQSLDYRRFVTHLKFLAQRLVTHSDLQGEESFLLEGVKEHYPQAYHCVGRIALYIKKRFGRELSLDEMTFLTVHIERLHRHEK